MFYSIVNLTRDVSVDGEQLVNFLNLPTCESGYWNFVKDSSTLWDRMYLHNYLARVSGIIDQIFVKIFIVDMSFDKEVLVKF